MRLIKANKKVMSVLLVVCAAVSASCASAAQLGDYRYKSWIDESNVIFRFDNQTGDIEKLVKAPSGPPMWVKCDIQQNKSNAAASQGLALSALPVAPMPAQVQTAPKIQQIPASVTKSSSAQLIEPMMMDTMAYKAESSQVVKASGGRIQFFDENNTDITDDINDADRTACRTTIASYEKSLSLISTIGTGGERTTGIVTLANNGPRRIKMLELSVCASKAGKDKSEVLHRILFAENKAGCEKPPAPSENGMKAPSVLKRVDIPTGAGSITGKPDVKVTFIKFEDQ